jgi:hypothetical protein
MMEPQGNEETMEHGQPAQLRAGVPCVFQSS